MVLQWLAKSHMRFHAGAFLSGVCMICPWMCEFSPGTLASSHSPQDAHVRLIGHSELPAGVNVSVCGCLSAGIGSSPQEPFVKWSNRRWMNAWMFVLFPHFLTKFFFVVFQNAVNQITHSTKLYTGRLVQVHQLHVLLHRHGSSSPSLGLLVLKI